MSTADNKRAVIVGIFVFLGIAILVAGILTLGGQQKTFVKSIRLKAVFDNVEGLQSGNNVWFSGVKVGKVEKITFLENSKVEIQLDVEKNIQGFLHKDAAATISSDGFIGNKIVMLSGGSPDLPQVEDGDLISTQKAINTTDMMETLQVNNKNLVDITGNLKEITSKIANGEGAIGAVLTDSVMAARLRSIVSSLEATAGNTTAISAALSRYTSQLSNEKSLANQLLTDTLIFHSLRASASSLETVTLSASEITQDLKAVTAKLDSSNNVAGLLLNDEETAESLKEMIENLQGSSAKLEENMEALQHNFLFRRYFRKKAKEEAGN